jgi:hypothetical protein
MEPDKDDVEPTGEEAEAQSEATIMPWLWGAIGVGVIALFVAWAIFIKPVKHPPAEPLQSPYSAPASHS